MFDIVKFPAFLLVVVALNLTPGPDITYIVGQTVAHGRRAGILSVLGISLGGCVHTILCAFGLTTLIAASPWAFTVIKYVGGVYLVYMGGKLLLYKATKSKNEVFIPRLTNRALVFRGGNQRFKPESSSFYITFFPQFVRPDSPNKTAAFIVLGAVLV
jgi:threonine/homoserine/homoserine lactone efflux protein